MQDPTLQELTSVIRLDPSQVAVIVARRDGLLGYLIAGNGVCLPVPAREATEEEREAFFTHFPLVDLVIMQHTMAAMWDTPPQFKLCRNCESLMPVTREYWYFRYDKPTTPCKDCKREYERNRVRERA